MPTLRNSFNSFIWSLLVLALVGPPARACLDWLEKPGIPACPKDGTSLLPDIYPAVGVVIPMGRFEKKHLTYDLIYKIICNSPEQIPLLIINGASSEIQKHILDQIPLIANQCVAHLSRDQAKKKAKYYERALTKSFVFSNLPRSAHRKLDYIQAMVDLLAKEMIDTPLKPIGLDLNPFLTSENKSIRPLKEEKLALLIEKTLKIIETRFASTLQENNEFQIYFENAQSEVQDPHGWERDYFRAVPANGQMSLRPIENFLGAESWGKDMASALTQALDQRCPGKFKMGEEIPAQLQRGRVGIPDVDNIYQKSGVVEAAMNQSFAGNMMGIPGGKKGQGVFHLTGSNMSWAQQSRHLGGAYKDTLTFPTEWLKIAHVDEVISIVKDAKSKAPCDFAISIVSPRRALELLTREENGNQKFLDFLGWDEKNPLARLNLLETQKIIQSRYSDFQIFALCHAIFLSEVSSRIRNISQRPDYASLSRNIYAQKKSLLKQCNPPELKNLRVAKMLEDPYSPMGLYNQKVQSILDRGLEKLMKNLREKTGCQNIKVISIPALFYNGEVQETPPSTEIFFGNTPKKWMNLSLEEKNSLPIDWRYQDTMKSTGLSLISNPVNSISLGESVIFPDPANEAFRNAIIEDYKSLGLKGVPVDSFEYNLKEGNVHCITNVILGCRSQPEEKAF